MAREFDPMRMSSPDPDKIACRDCVYRDMETIDLGDDVIECGITKGFCDAFPEGGETNGKPLDVLFQSAPCPEYEKDERVQS